MNLKMIKLIHVLQDGYPIKSGNYCIRMGVYNECVKTYFISPKQWFKLSALFSFNGEPKYSDRDNRIYGVFEDDRFIWASSAEEIEWLAKTFNAKLTTNISWRSSKEKKKIPVLKPRNVEILPELRDTDEGI